MARKNYESPEAAREAILDAAQDTVVEVGPAGLRISAVAKRAGMAHPNIIHHFGSREGLLNALADRVGERATARITGAISDALDSDSSELVDAMAKVFSTAYAGDEGKAAIWLHLSDAEADNGMKDNMSEIVDLSHQLRTRLEPSVTRENTSRIVLLVTLALVGEVVAGDAIKSALGYQHSGSNNRAQFKRWLAELLLELSDEELPDSLNTKEK